MLPYSGFRTEPRVPLALAVPLPAPIVVHVEPTNVCNFACTFCPESRDDYFARSGGKSTMTRKEFSLVATELLALGHPIKHLNFHVLGEPLVNKDTPWMIAEATRRNVAQRTILTTNASLLDRAKAEEILDSGLDYLRVSVYGLDQKEFTSNTQRKAPWWIVKDNVSLLWHLRRERKQDTPFINCKMIGTDSHEEGAGRFRKTFGPISDECRVDPLGDWNGDGKLAGVPDGIKDSKFFAHRKRVCPAPFYTLIVNADLKVTICCVDWNKQTLIGDLREEGLHAIWHGEKLRRFQRMHLEGRRGELPGCSTCSWMHTLQDNLDCLTREEFDDRLAAAANDV